jgi:hypothetical protein
MSEAATRGTPFTRRLAVFIERRAGLIVLLTLVFAVVAGLGASRLRVDQRLRKLLPDDFPSVTGMDRVAARLGNQSDIYVGIHGPSRAANIAFGKALAADLEGHPDLRWAVFERDFSFFEQHALLYADVDDLLDLRCRVIERIFEETRHKAYGELSLVDDEPVPGGGSPAAGAPDAAKPDDANALGLDEAEIRRRYGLDEGRSAYFEADEGRLFVLKARPVQESTNLAFASRLQGDLEARIARLDPTSFHPELKIDLEGSFIQHGNRAKQLQGEVAGGTAAAVIAILLSIALFFRSARAVLLVLGPLFVAGAGALAFAWMVYDVLNLVSAFIFAVLTGLGIDFAIHVLARYRDERARGHRRPTAFAITLATTGRSNMGGGLGTGLAFGALTIADFQGFAQFGVVACFGLVLTLFTSMVVMPAAVTLMERWRPWAPPPRRFVAGMFPRWLLRLGMVTVGFIAIAGTGVSVWAATRANELAFEYDFRAMGPKDAEDAEKAADRQVTYRDAIGKALTVAPAIALADTREEARAVYQQLMALRVMLPEEAAALVPIAASREPSLVDAVSPQGLDKQIPPPADPTAAVAPDAVPAPPSLAPPAAAGDDWDADPEQWVEGRDPARTSDDWDANPEDWAEPDSAAEKPRAPGLDDPRFLAIARAEAARTIPDPETLEQLRRYDPKRRMDMADRLGAVTSIDAFVPTQQAVKLEIMADIRTRLDAKRSAMSDATRADIDAWYDRLAIAEPIDIEQLPPWVRQQFEDTDGEVGRFVIAWTRGSKADYLNARRIYDALAVLETPQGEVTVAAEFFVLPEVFEAIEHDGPRVLVLATVAMLLTTVMAFRGFGGPAVVTMVVGTSVLWVVALMLLLGWKLNFFNVIVLPLLIGMAQDDALHIYERWREAGPGQLGTVLRETGGAVFLTSETTICGFAGILFANHRGLQSLAWMAVAGMTLALIAAVALLTAMLWVVDRITLARRAREAAPPTNEG